jgi:hypothetical protein
MTFFPLLSASAVSSCSAFPAIKEPVFILMVMVRHGLIYVPEVIRRHQTVAGSRTRLPGRDRPAVLLRQARRTPDELASHRQPAAASCRCLAHCPAHASPNPRNRPSTYCRSARRKQGGKGSLTDLAQYQPGHIRGTSARDLPGSVENCRDLIRRSAGIPGASTEVSRILAQDPAYRPTRPLSLA